MLNIKRFACTGLAAILVVSLPACGKDKLVPAIPPCRKKMTQYIISVSVRMKTATITTISHRALTMP